jgi:hypothetical protein
MICEKSAGTNVAESSRNYSSRVNSKLENAAQLYNANACRKAKQLHRTEKWNSDGLSLERVLGLVFT